MTNETTTQPERSNTALWLLLASFIIPAIAAYSYFFYGDRPSSNNNGELITPIIDIEALKLSNDKGEIVSRDDLTPKWRMYYFVHSNCNNECQSSLYNMRQINIALGKNRDRVQHVIVHLEKSNEEFLQLISKEYMEAILLHTEIENITALSDKETGAVDTQSIYLVDPLGNIMMKFNKSITPKLILKDINKLLKISRIG